MTAPLPKSRRTNAKCRRKLHHSDQWQLRPVWASANTLTEMACPSARVINCAVLRLGLVEFKMHRLQCKRFLKRKVPPSELTNLIFVLSHSQFLLHCHFKSQALSITVRRSASTSLSSALFPVATTTSFLALVRLSFSLVLGVILHINNQTLWDWFDVHEVATRRDSAHELDASYVKTRD